MAKTSKETAPKHNDFGVAHETVTEMDGYTCNFVTIRQGHDLAPMLAHLPTGRCECPHWGMVFRGRITVRYVDREEVIEAGEAYYMPPGHAPAADDGTEFVMFSPTDLLEATDAAVKAAMARMQAVSPNGS